MFINTNIKTLRDLCASVAIKLLDLNMLLPVIASEARQTHAKKQEIVTSPIKNHGLLAMTDFTKVSNFKEKKYA